MGSGLGIGVQGVTGKDVGSGFGDWGLGSVGLWATGLGFSDYRFSGPWELHSVISQDLGPKGPYASALYRPSGWHKP